MWSKPSAMRVPCQPKNCCLKNTVVFWEFIPTNELKSCDSLWGSWIYFCPFMISCQTLLGLMNITETIIQRPQSLIWFFGTSISGGMFRGMSSYHVLPFALSSFEQLPWSIIILWYPSGKMVIQHFIRRLFSHKTNYNASWPNDMEVNAQQIWSISSHYWMTHFVPIFLSWK